MLRRFIIIANALIFGWVQTAFAMKAGQMDSAYQFLKDSGLTQHDVTIKEMYEKFGNTLPEPIRLQMEHFAKENPNYTIPKMDVKKVKVKDEDQLQFNVNSDRGSLVVTTQGSKDVFATVIGSYDGKKVQTEVKYDFFLAGHKVVYEARKDMNNRKFKVLTPSEFEKLTLEEKKLYGKHLREVVAAAEKVQNAREEKSQPVSVYEKFFREALIGQAWAAEACMFAGYTTGTWGSIGGGKQGCQSPHDAKCGNNQFKCNPELYGDVGCIAKDPANSLTERCNGADPDFTHFATAHVYSAKDDLQKALDKEWDACSRKADNEDQKKACKQYTDRISELKKACASEKLKTRYENICKSGADPVPVPTPQGPVSPGNPTCKDLADNESKLTVDNCEKNDNQVTCESGKIYKYCSACKSGFNGFNTGSIPVTKCEKIAEQKPGKDGKDGKDGRDGGSGKDGKEKSLFGSIGNWFSSNSSWLVPTGLIFLMMWLGYKSQQQMIQAQYQPYIQAQNTYQPPVAAPPATTNPVLSTPNPGAR